MTNVKVDVVIPTYKPGNKFKALLLRLRKQSVKINKIIVINTEEKYFADFFKDSSFLDSFKNLEVTHISASEFDHGKTRGQAVLLSDADYFVCMTDDAVPMDRYLIEKLLAHVVTGEAAVSYGRQCAGPDSTELERFTRKFNYPVNSYFKNEADIKRLGIKTYFCSNVCACYDRAVYDKLGGFVEHTIFNEDMIYASKVIKAGYSIYYASDAKVRHNHHYSGAQQLRRNFDLGVSQKQYSEIFDEVPSTTEGKRMVLETIKHLFHCGKALLIPELIVMSGYKYIGYYLGKHYTCLPEPVISKITMNKNYWKKN